MQPSAFRSRAGCAASARFAAAQRAAQRACAAATPRCTPPRATAGGADALRCGASAFVGVALVHALRAAPARHAAAAATAMANPRRSQKVGQQIMREVSLLILNDKRARSAMSPEHRLGADGNISTVMSITDVVISGDLQVAKIYVSFFGDARGADVAFAGLQRLEPYLRSQVGKAMQMRHVPELRFFRDEGAARGGRVMSLLAELRSEAQGAAALATEQAPPAPRGRAGALAGGSESDSTDVDEPLMEYDSADDDIILINDGPA